MNKWIRRALYVALVAAYFIAGYKMGANFENWFVTIATSVSAFALFGWVLPRPKSDQSAADVSLAGGVYQPVRFSGSEAAARRRKV